MTICVKTSFIDFWAIMSKHSGLAKADFKNDHHEIRYASGVDFAACNGIFPKESIVSISDEEIENHVNYFQQKKLPFVWWTDSPILATKGFTFGGCMKGIMTEVKHPEPVTQIEGFKIVPAVTEEQIRIFSKVLVEGMEVPSKDLISKQFYSVNLGSAKAGKQLHFLGYYQDIPVSTISISLHEDATGLWNGVTLPLYRRKGFLTALIQHALWESKARNKSKVMAILMPKGMASGPTKKCGFQEICDFPFYIYGTQTLE